MKRCKIFLCALTVALSGIMSYSNVKAESDSGDLESLDGGMTSKNVLVNILEKDVISIDVQWGSMEFTYNRGNWNASNHTYTASLPQGHTDASIQYPTQDPSYKGWSVESVAEGAVANNEIIVTNNSNVYIEVQAVFGVCDGQSSCIRSQFSTETSNGANVNVDESSSPGKCILPVAQLGSDKAATVNYKLFLDGSPDIDALTNNNNSIGTIQLNLQVCSPPLAT